MAVRKKIASIACAVLLCLVAVPLAGCSGTASPEEQIRTALVEQLDALANKESEARTQMASMLSESKALEPYGIDTQAFCDALFEGFAYSIDSVEVDDEAGSATAKATLKAKSLTDVASAATEGVGELAAGEDVSLLTEADVNARLGKIIMQAVQDAEPHETELSLAFSRDDEGVWSANENVAVQVANVFLGDEFGAGDQAAPEE